MKAVCSGFVDIPLPVGAVYDFVSDIGRWPIWLSFVVCAQQRGEPVSRAIALDQEIDVCMQRGKRRWREAFDVIRLVPNAFVWLEGSVSAARRLEFRFEQRRSATRVHASFGYPVFGGALGALRDALFLRRATTRELRESMRQLSDVLAGSTDDGMIGALMTDQAAFGEEPARGSAKQAVLT